MAPNEPSSARLYSIDELATRTALPSRTIRFYQSKGLLQKPDRQGRTAHYTDDHVARITLIGELRQRGLSLATIEDLLARRVDLSLSVSDWLGLSERLQSPWSEDTPELVSAEDLSQRLAAMPPGTLDALLREGLVEAQPAESPLAYRIVSPGLLALLVRMVDAGIEVATALDASRVIRRHMREAAQEVVAKLASQVGAGFGSGSDPAQIAQAIDGVRQVAADAVKLLFVAELNDVLGIRSSALSKLDETDQP